MQEKGKVDLGDDRRKGRNMGWDWAGIVKVCGQVTEEVGQGKGDMEKRRSNVWGIGMEDRQG